MRKTSVYLTEEDGARLSALAVREGVSQAEVLRRAIHRYAPKRRVGRDEAGYDRGDGAGGSTDGMRVDAAPSQRRRTVPATDALAVARRYPADRGLLAALAQALTDTTDDA